MPGTRDNQTPGVLAGSPHSGSALFEDGARRLNKKYNPSGNVSSNTIRPCAEHKTWLSKPRSMKTFERMMCSGYHTSGLAFAWTV